MLRAASSTLGKRAFARSGAHAPKLSNASFHYSARREEEAKEETSSEVADKGGFMGTGLSHLYAIPAGVAFGVPILEFNWFLVNEETLLASTFVMFCVVAYTQGGDAIAKMFKDEGDAMLALQHEAEDEIIAKMEENLAYMKLTENIVQDYQDILELTGQSYEKLNAAGAIKPKHVLKAQVEKMLTVIAAEEANAYDKAKTALMVEATDAVTAKFLDDKALKKAALDNAMSKLTTGKAMAGGDPVQGAFVKFFSDKSAAAKKADDGSEQKEARANMIMKMNAVAEAEGMYFRLDDKGTPKMVA
ncbi:unnamed protein product [Cylindrotheca closterium]|uniref:ATP synthase subunit b n=1 Tax=Cylindrotheca closterium TaxID=2856 RepID=A0AAD2FM31_9STRA|nr:unnamed protein product [Cylindrotheca closterium]